MRVTLLVALLVGAFAVPVEAQSVTGQGRPDPTGRGRYLQYGQEVARAGATVLKTLPAGAVCAPAGELVGVPLWNTTREGKVIVSVLTDKAEVAMVGNRTFLCWCADGFNELFVPTATSSVRESTLGVSAAPAPTTTARAEAVARVEIVLPDPSAYQVRSGSRCGTWCKLGIGAALGAGTYGLGRYNCWW